MDRVAEAQAIAPMIGVDEAQRRLADAQTAVIDVRDASQIQATGIIPGAHHVSLGTMLYKADLSLPEAWRDPVFTSLDRPLITTCETGEMASIAARELIDLGYTNVSILSGGTVGWKDAGQPINSFNGL